MSFNIGERLAVLREERSAELGKMTALIDKAERQGRHDLTVAEQREYDHSKARAGELNGRIDRLEFARDTGSGVSVIRDAEDKREKGVSFARCVLALAATKGNIRAASEYAARTLRDGLVSKALAAGSGSAGGFTIPEEWTGEVIELLRPQAAVRALNPVLVPLPRGNATLGGLGSGATVGYIGENQNILATQPSFRQVRLSAKKLAALVPMSNDLLRFSAGSADTMVRDDLLAAITQAEDLTFLRSQGTEYSPKGLRYWAAAGNVLPMTATPTTVTVEADLGALVLALRNANVRFLRPGWIFAPRTEEALVTARDKNGNFIYRAEMTAGRLRGFPFRSTTQVPLTLGAGTESEIFLADFADVLIGEVPGIEIEVSSQAAYHDGANLVAAFSLDQTIIKIVMQNDLAVRHPESVAVLTGVTWAAPLAQPV